MKKSVFLVICAIVVLSIATAYFILPKDDFKETKLSFEELMPSIDDFPSDENWIKDVYGTLKEDEMPNNYLSENRTSGYTASYIRSGNDLSIATIKINAYTYSNNVPRISQRNVVTIDSNEDGEYLRVYDRIESPISINNSMAYDVISMRPDGNSDFEFDPTYLIEFTMENVYFEISISGNYETQELDELTDKIISKF